MEAWQAAGSGLCGVAGGSPATELRGSLPQHHLSIMALPQAQNVRLKDEDRQIGPDLCFTQVVKMLSCSSNTQFTQAEAPTATETAILNHYPRKAAFSRGLAGCEGLPTESVTHA